jgi:hypothetical protein
VTEESDVQRARRLGASRRREPITRLDEVRKSHNIVAAFDSVRTARAVIESLEAAGIDGSDISLLGAQLADNPADQAPATADSPVTRVGRNLAVGAVAGGVVGATIGVVALDVATITAGALGFVLGASVGGVIGGYAGVGIARAWRDTFRPLHRGNIAVGVHSADAEALEIALPVMESYSPLAVNQFHD